jgi:plastocyanin
VVAALACAAVPGSASAATVDVSATSENTFSPGSRSIAPGDTVHFTNNGGNHNVHFEDGQFQQPMSPSPVWADPVQRTFPTEGRFAYYCDQHGGPGGAGMSGVISVKAAGGGGGGGGPTLTPPPTIKKFGLVRARGGAIRVVLRASAAATARVTLARRSHGRYRKLKAVKRKIGAKAITVIFRARRGTRFKPGRYRVTVKLTESNGNSSPSKSKKIRLS